MAQTPSRAKSGPVTDIRVRTPDINNSLLSGLPHPHTKAQAVQQHKILV
jgi:hypothetical protein